MLIYIINTDLEIERAFDITKSVIWNNRYYGYGEFEVYMQATMETVESFKIGKILVREGSEENAMIIESIQIQTDNEAGDYITIKGRCLKSILYRRIIWNQTNIMGSLEGGIERLLKENAIQPENNKRKIEWLNNKNVLKTGITVKCQYTGNNLGETIEALCKSYLLGWDIALNLEDKTMEFYLYRGSNRSWSQQEHPCVVFSEDYENLSTTDYTIDQSNYKNVAKVAGEGEGLERKYMEIGTARGLERCEIFVDARDLSTNEGEITEEEYNRQMEDRGLQSLAENAITKEFSGEILEFTNIYGRDYFLGDIVEVQNKYGIGATARITEVIESEDESGTYTIPTFEFDE
ncbi:MAG: siphovirus ReqiPepy6 Gp37-like family protein [Lachnospiraceae bacterium]|nr:siphovirus ReqiPepy6 Gp37-like family protein [Lachnospiraceae bacterium]